MMKVLLLSLLFFQADSLEGVLSLLSASNFLITVITALSDYRSRRLSGESTTVWGREQTFLRVKKARYQFVFEKQNSLLKCGKMFE